MKLVAVRGREQPSLFDWGLQLATGTMHAARLHPSRADARSARPFCTRKEGQNCDFQQVWSSSVHVSASPPYAQREQRGKQRPACVCPWLRGAREQRHIQDAFHARAFRHGHHQRVRLAPPAPHGVRRNLPSPRPSARAPQARCSDSRASRRGASNGTGSLATGPAS